MAIGVAFQTPVARVPTAVRLEVTTALPRLVASRTLVPAIRNSLALAMLTCSEKSQLSVLFVQTIVWSVAPLSVMPPPLAVASVGVETLPSSMFLSSTLSVVLLTVVVVPLTVRFPAIVMLSSSFAEVIAPSAISLVLIVPDEADELAEKFLVRCLMAHWAGQ